MRDALTYAELFAGAGGLSMGLESAGFVPFAHAEIEPHARAVLRQHWPDTRLDGDVTCINGADYRGITLLSGGSPCQDLSVAGKRAGLGGARSGLFYEQCRIWHESEAPYLLWENVAGALSSNGGKDFAAVLSALVGATIPVPADGWQRGGVAAGRTAVAAWRVSDLQHFGPPQRRVRVFVLAARAGGVDPAEVLALGEGVCGHPAPREQAREGSTAGLVGRFAGGSVGTLETRPQRAVAHEAAQGHVLAIDLQQVTSVANRSTPKSEAPTLNQAGNVIAFHPTQDPISGAVSPSLGTTTDGMGVVCTTGPVTHALTAEGCDASEDGTGRGTPIVANCITAREAKGWNPARDVGNGTVQNARPRRLTPLECERLMSWPDGHTAHGVREDGTRYALSDTARYRLCGNGVASVQVAWIARRLAWAVNRQNRVVAA
jgi:DNA (cytosine-5)-methyltransferase 1